MTIHGVSQGYNVGTMQRLIVCLPFDHVLSLLVSPDDVTRAVPTSGVSQKIRERYETTTSIWYLG